MYLVVCVDIYIVVISILYIDCTGIVVITGLLMVLGRKKSMAINTATLATFYGLLYLCAGKCVYATNTAAKNPLIYVFTYIHINLLSYVLITW